MKQNDWIVLGVGGVIALAVMIFSVTQARQPEVPPKPEPVPTSPVDIPAPAIVFTNGLPGGSSQSGGAGGGGESRGGGGSTPGAGQKRTFGAAPTG
jgi:hypothetical protein